jgi:hypothetical protein
VVRIQRISTINFASILNSGLSRKGWTPTKLLVASNVLTDDDREVFGYRALEEWLAGRHLPNIGNTVVMAAALEMPELIDTRVQAEIEKLGLKKKYRPRGG